MILLRPSEKGELRAAHVTNHRWALSALGAGAACTLKPDDTVLSCVPLHHPTGILVSVGAAVVAGSRLALAERFAPDSFLSSARRVGATVVFYAGEMLRALLFERPGKGDHTLPVRLFAGSGMRPDLAARLKERFGTGAMEFYAGTAQRVILANATGEKPGALGRVLPGSAEVAVVRVDLVARKPARDEEGFFCVRAPRGEPGPPRRARERGRRKRGVEVGRSSRGRSSRGTAGSSSTTSCARTRTGTIGTSIRSPASSSRGGKAVSTRKVEDALYALPEVELAAAVGVRGEVSVAFVAREHVDEARIAEAFEKLEEHERPTLVRQVPEIPLTDGFRPRKAEVLALLGREAPAPISSRPSMPRL